MAPIFIKAERDPRMDLRKKTSRYREQTKNSNRNWQDREWGHQEDRDKQQDLRERTMIQDETYSFPNSMCSG